MRKIILLFAWLSLSASAFSQNLVAYYPYNGNANDQSGNSINPTYIGAGVYLTTDRFGYPGKAYYFDGLTGSYMRMPAGLLPTTNRTISLWFNVSDVSNRPGLLGYGGNGSCGTTLLMGLNCTGSGQYWVQGHCGANQAAYTYPTVPINNWYHWVLTISGSAQKIYVNGQLKSTDNTFSGSTAVAGKDFALGTVTFTDGTAPFTDVNVGYFKGKLDDVRIYDAAMSDAQVLQLYNDETVGLVAYYPFMSNADDFSGNGNNGTVNGAALTTDRFGNANNAYSFNGTSDFISTANLATTATDNWSMTAWIKPASLNQLGSIVINGSDNGGGSLSGYSMLLGDGVGGSGNKLTGLFPGVEWINPNLSLATSNVWYHVAMVRNSGVTTIYLNGVAGSVTTSAAPTLPSGSLRIGSQMGLRFFNGAIDEVKVFNKALSAAQVLQFYDVELPGLVAYYPFNGNANDASGYGRNGTVMNGAVLTTDRFGNANSAYDFDGINDYIDISATGLPETNRTVMFWLNPTTGNQPSYPLTYGGSSCGNSFLMGFNTSNANRYNTQGHCNSNNLASPVWSVDPANQWTHFSVTISGTTIKIFINGVEVNSNTGFSNPTVVEGKKLFIGALTTPDGLGIYIDGSGGYFKGKLDDVKIFNTALTNTQIAYEYSGLAAYFPFDGNANDVSGNNHNGVVSGATLTTDRSGNSNSAYIFNGSSDFIDINQASTLNLPEYTYSAWVYLNAYPPGTNVQTGAGTILDIGNISVDQYIYIVNYNPYYGFSGSGYYIGGGAYDVRTGVLPNLNQWYHVAVTRNSTEAKLFVNGILIQTVSLLAAGPDYGISPSGLIGKRFTDIQYFNGKIDEVRIYNRALSPNEILKLADVPMMPDLIAYLPMNGNTNDVSGNGRHGTVVNLTPTTDKYSHTNSAYSFDPYLSDFSLSNSTSLDFMGSDQKFTLSAWVKYPLHRELYQAIISKINTGSGGPGFVNGYILGTENNYYKFWMPNGNSGNWNILQTPCISGDTQWHHIVGTFNGTTQSLYVDGELKASGPEIYNMPATGAPVKIGSVNVIGYPTGGGVFNGCIDEVKIYGDALDANHVMALYKQSRGSGNAISLKANDYVDIGHIAAETNITMESWVKRNNNSSLHYFISGYDYNSYGFGVTSGAGGNQLFFITQNNQTALSSSVDKLNDGNWHHVAVTSANGSVTFYFDGRIAGTPVLNLTGLISNDYVIGSKLNYLGTSLDGEMDEVRIWNGALLQAEIRDWMTRKLTPDHPSYNRLIRYYNFDEKNMFNTIDAKGANTGNLVNNVTMITSGASLGDAAVHNIANPSVPATLTLSTGENFSALQGAGTALGLFVYVVKDPPENQTGIAGLGGNDHYFGVKKAEDFSVGTTASYTATYDYTGNTLVTPVIEPFLQLYKRNNNSATPWTNSGASLNTTTNTLTVTGQNTEYILGSLGFALPVSLLNLQARKTNATTAQLTWQTATEINSKGFELQRSFDGNFYADVQFVNGAGNSIDTREYSVTDVPGRTGRVYYRLKQIDLDGSIRLSNVVTVLFDKQGNIKVYPNPAQTQVTVEGLDSYNRLQVMDANGKLLKDIYTNGQYQVSINLNGLKSGIYLLRMINEKETQTVKLIISN